MDKKFSSKSLSALVFALGVAPVAQANTAHNVEIRSLELSEESSVSEEEFHRMVNELRRVTASRNWGGSGSHITSGNYPNHTTAGNYPNHITAGNYPDHITAGNYPNHVTAGNYGRLNPNDIPDAIPSPVVLEAFAGDDTSEN